MASPITELNLTLLWSLWTELGVPGLARSHGHFAVDPEPLLVATPWLAMSDARLQAEVMRWCVAHGDRISASRLLALAATAPPHVRQAFDVFAANLAAQSRVRWRPAAQHHGPRTKATKSPPSLPVTRAALVRFRLRAIAGVGARADVLAELISHPDTWVVASDLNHLGYSKRNVSRVLTELAESGLTRSRRSRNAVAFQLGELQPWQALVGGADLTWPRWAALFLLAVTAAELSAQTDKPEPVKRVAAASAQARLAELAAETSQPLPPDVRGQVAAFEMTMAWCEGVLADWAAGKTPAAGQGEKPSTTQ